MSSNTSLRTQSPDTQPVLWLGVVSAEEWYGIPVLERMLPVLMLREAMERYHREWYQQASLLAEAQARRRAGRVLAR